MSKPHFVLENCLANFDDISLLLVFHVLGVEYLCNCEKLINKKKENNFFCFDICQVRIENHQKLLLFAYNEKEIMKSMN